MASFLESLKPTNEASPAKKADPAPEATTATQTTTEGADKAPTKAEPGKVEGQPKKPQENGLLAAAKAERDKRQKAEAEAHYLRGRLEAFEKGKTEPETKGPTDDELDNEILLTPHKAVRGLAERIANERAAEIRATTSEAVMRELKPDYQEKFDKFTELLERETPEGKAQIYGFLSHHPFPAKAVYDYMSQQAKQPVDEAALRKTIEAEVEARLRKELAVEEAQNTTKTPAGKPGGGPAQPASDVPTIENLFESRRKKFAR